MMDSIGCVLKRCDTCEGMRFLDLDHEERCPTCNPKPAPVEVEVTLVSTSMEAGGYVFRYFFASNAVHVYDAKGLLIPQLPRNLLMTALSFQNEVNRWRVK